MFPALALLAAHNGGVFSRRQALACGHTPEEVRLQLLAGLWVRLRQGIYVDHLVLEMSSPAERAVLDIAAARLAVSVPSTGSHHSAALAYGLPLLTPTDAVTLSAPTAMLRGGTGERIRVARAKLVAEHCWDLRGVAVTSPARTAADLAESLSLVDAVTVTDAALHRGLATRDEIAAVIDALGLGRAPYVLAAADARSESPLESVSRVALALEGIEVADLQRDLFDAAGRFLGRVDFLWERQRVIGEADGMLKYDDPGALRREKRRQEALENAGFVVVRWTWDEIMYHPEWVAARLRHAFARAA